MLEIQYEMPGSVEKPNIQEAPKHEMVTPRQKMFGLVSMFDNASLKPYLCCRHIGLNSTQCLSVIISTNEKPDQEKLRGKVGAILPTISSSEDFV